MWSDGRWQGRNRRNSLDIPLLKGLQLQKYCFIYYFFLHNHSSTRSDALIDVMFSYSTIAQSMSLRESKIHSSRKGFGQWNNRVTAWTIEIQRIFTYYWREYQHKYREVLCGYCKVLQFCYQNHPDKFLLWNKHIWRWSGEGSAGRNLYNKLKDNLPVNNIPLAWWWGEFSSLCRILKRSSITIFKSIYLPWFCEDVVRHIYSQFSHSSRRKHKLKQF